MAREPGGKKSKYANVRVAKDIVKFAKRTAVLREQRLEDFVSPLLTESAKLAEAEIAEKGVDAVAARANALTDLEKVANLGPLNVDPSISLPLVRLAGSIPTSIAKLLDHHLRGLVYRRYKESLLEAAPLWVGIAPEGPGQPPGNYNVTEKFSGGNVFLWKVPDDSLSNLHIDKGDYLLLDTHLHPLDVARVSPQKLFLGKHGGRLMLVRGELDADNEVWFRPIGSGGKLGKRIVSGMLELNGEVKHMIREF